MGELDAAEIGRLLRTQDNRITSDPIFMVQEKKRAWGIDRAFDPEEAWVDQTTGDYCVADEQQAARLQELAEQGEDTRLGNDEDGWVEYELVGYADHWENVQPFFTEKAADEYIARNRHRHNGDLRVYVESGNRNPEWKFIREMLVNCAIPAVAEAK